MDSPVDSQAWDVARRLSRIVECSHSPYVQCYCLSRPCSSRDDITNMVLYYLWYGHFSFHSRSALELQHLLSWKECTECGEDATVNAFEMTIRILGLR